MKLIPAVLAALMCGPAIADMVHRDGDDYARLQTTPCAGPVLEMLPPAARTKFFSAVSQVDGKQYAGCWALRTDRVVVMQWEDGDDGLLRLSEFKPEAGI